LRDIFLSDSRTDRETVTYTAASAYIVRTEHGPQLVMVDGMAQTLRNETRSLVTTAFDDLAYDLGTLVTIPDATRRSARELMTWELLAPTPALAEETRRSVEQLYTRAHVRFARSFQPLVSALVGFAALMVGGFSRFGVWRQIVAAIFLIILIKIVESVVTSSVAATPALWPLTYLPELFGAALAFALLGWSARPAWFLRRRERPGLAVSA